MLRYKTETRPGLVALYDIRPGNGAGPFLQLRSPHGAPHSTKLRFSWRVTVSQWVALQETAWPYAKQYSIYGQYSRSVLCPSVLWRCWFEDNKGIRPVRKTGCRLVGGDNLTGA